MRAVCLLAPLKLSQAQSGSIFQRAGFPPPCHSMFQTEQLSTELRGVVQSRMFRGYTLLLAVPASSACGRAESPMGVEIRSCFVISP
jgi:hypothetical protein